MRVLVVEDDDNLRRSIVDILRDEGFAVDAAGDGREALHKLLNWDYDATVLDVMLPFFDGFEVLKRIRAAGKKVPTLMLTARSALKDKVHGLNAGADDYLTKPFDMEELLARIQAVIRRSEGRVQSVIRSGPIEIDTSRKIVKRDGGVVELTAREYAILEILMMKESEVISRDYLYEHLFDEHEDTLSNMIEVYMYKLRNKIGKDLIRTRRGMGYQFVGSGGR